MIYLSETIAAEDDDPPFRDEQRAWYDALRDFVPAFEGLQPTVKFQSHGRRRWFFLFLPRLSRQTIFSKSHSGQRLNSSGSESVFMECSRDLQLVALCGRD